MSPYTFETKFIRNELGQPVRAESFCTVLALTQGELTDEMREAAKNHLAERCAARGLEFDIDSLEVVSPQPGWYGFCAKVRIAYQEPSDSFVEKVARVVKEIHRERHEKVEAPGG